MIRVYLDWNIYSYLKTYKDSKEPYKAFNKNLLKNSEAILVPYSSAHLSDLITSYNQSEKGKAETEQDLEYLADLTKHHCILFDSKKQTSYPDICNIQEYFQNLIEGESLFKGDFSDVFRPTEGTELEPYSKFYLDFLKTTPLNFDGIGVEKIPEKYDIIKNIFKGNNIYDLLNGTMAMINEYMNDPTAYRLLRNQALTDLKLTHDYTNVSDPIQEISKNLSKSALNMSFNEFVDFIIKCQFKDKPPSNFDIFTTNYIMLDFLGYYRDKKFKNLLQDSFHAFYGAHCDFFVTDDDNTYNKTKILYKHLGIDTIVCKSNEFNNNLYSKLIINNHSKKNLLEEILEVIDKSFVITDKRDSELNPVHIFKADIFILNFFNRVQITYLRNGNKIICLFKKCWTYSSFYFFSEAENLVNQLYIELGVDYFNKTKYIPEIENRELQNWNWKGRTWLVGNVQIELQMRDFPIGLTLVLDFDKNYFR